jgi:hypothetical protein
MAAQSKATGDCRHAVIRSEDDTQQEMTPHDEYKHQIRL